MLTPFLWVMIFGSLWGNAAAGIYMVLALFGFGLYLHGYILAPHVSTPSLRFWVICIRVLNPVFCRQIMYKKRWHQSSAEPVRQKLRGVPWASYFLISLERSGGGIATACKGGQRCKMVHICNMGKVCLYSSKFWRG